TRRSAARSARRLPLLTGEAERGILHAVGIGEDTERETLAATPEGRRRAAESHVFLAASTARVLSSDEAARALAFARALVALTAAGVVALPFLYNPARPLYWPMAG